MFDQSENSPSITISDSSKDFTQELHPHLPHFDFDAAPLVWIKNAPIKTFYETYLSITLQMLEDFMISTIKEVIPEITDQQLLQNAKAFCEQEQNHADQHSHFNQKMYALGLDTVNLKPSQEKFKTKLGNLTINERLQLTAFIEGITAGFAYEIICNRFLREDWHPQAKELYLWHCIEEYQHRCLAFDVYIEKVKVHKPSFILITRTITPLFFQSLKFMFKNLKKHKLLWSKQTLRDVIWFVGLHGPIFYILKCYYRFFSNNYNPQYIYYNLTIESIVQKWEDDFHVG